MAVKMVRVSDLTGKTIESDDDVVTVVVLDHPQIESPVQLDASKADVKQVSGTEKDYAVIELVSDGGDQRERMVLELAQFDKLFSTDVDEALRNAEKYLTDPAPVSVQDEPRRRGRPAVAASKGSPEKINYRELPNSGLPHRGKTTEEEAAVVRANLDAVNRNRAAAGHKPIDPMDANDARRYGFDQIKEADRAKLSPEFKS